MTTDNTATVADSAARELHIETFDRIFGAIRKDVPDDVWYRIVEAGQKFCEIITAPTAHPYDIEGLKEIFFEGYHAGQNQLTTLPDERMGSGAAGGEKWVSVNARPPSEGYCRVKLKDEAVCDAFYIARKNLFVTPDGAEVLAAREWDMASFCLTAPAPQLADSAADGERNEVEI